MLSRVTSWSTGTWSWPGASLSAATSRSTKRVAVGAGPLGLDMATRVVAWCKAFFISLMSSLFGGSLCFTLKW